MPRGHIAEATVTPIVPIREPFDFPLSEKSVTFKGVTYKFRELTMAENDECRELATDKDQNYDGRIHMRTMIVLGSVDPHIDLESLNKFPQRLYARIIEMVAELNDEGSLDEEAEGNA